MWSILIVEDEQLIALDLASLIREQVGAEAQLLHRLPDAYAAIESHVDFVFLDINLGDVTTYEFGRELLWRRIPFTFVTGSDKSLIPVDLRTVPVIVKPFTTKAIAAALLSGLEHARADTGLRGRNGT